MLPSFKWPDWLAFVLFTLWFTFTLVWITCWCRRRKAVRIPSPVLPGLLALSIVDSVLLGLQLGLSDQPWAAAMFTRWTISSCIIRDVSQVISSEIELSLILSVDLLSAPTDELAKKIPR